jgi:AAA-like domain/CHAT domain
MSLEFENFELRIEPNLAGGTGGYRATVLKSPAGETRAHDFILDALGQDLRELLQELGQNSRGTRGEERHLTFETNPIVQGAVGRFGAKLFQTVLDGDVGEAWRNSLNQLGNSKGLRIQLRLTETPELIELPWEYLRDPGPPAQFVFKSDSVSLVRYLELPKRIQPLSVQLPLTILVMIANPPGTRQLDVQVEWEHLKKALAKLEAQKQVILELLPDAKLLTLQERFHDKSKPACHIFHYIGHGGFDEKNIAGVLLLEGSDGGTQRVNAEQLADQLQNHKTLSLAVLNACEGARTSARDPFAGIAQTLAGRCLPAVIAMQFEISDKAAIRFASNFYDSLALGHPVDTALSQARLAISTLEESNLEFGIPVLYMRSADGKIFDIANTTPSGSQQNPLPDQAAPIPSDLENPDNLVDPSSPFYIERDSDRKVLAALQRNGVTITIKSPSGLGLGLLLNRVRLEAKKLGKRIAYLDFSTTPENDLSNAEGFFKSFCTMVSLELDVPDNTDEFWALNLPNAQRTKRYFTKHLLPSLDGQVLLAINRVDHIFEANFRTEFFGMLRLFHNERGPDPTWKRLDLILTTSTEPSGFIKNHYQSPFNVGESVELLDFDITQVSELNQRYGGPMNDMQLQQLIGLVGGHPYMVGRALYLTASRQFAIQALFDQAASDRGPFKDTLRKRLEKLLRSPQHEAGMRQVIGQQRCLDEILFSHLQGAGLVISNPWPKVIPRYAIFQTYFQDHLRG